MITCTILRNQQDYTTSWSNHLIEHKVHKHTRVQEIKWIIQVVDPTISQTIETMQIKLETWKDFANISNIWSLFCNIAKIGGWSYPNATNNFFSERETKDNVYRAILVVDVLSNREVLG